jgi:ElaA protein
MSYNLNYQCLPFQELILNELYELLALRQEVFVVEQTCPYQDADGLDQLGWHVLGRDKSGKLLAYTRILPKGISYEAYPAIGRVVTSPSCRGKGYGKELMQVSIQYTEQLCGAVPIKISAQCYLIRFYEELGFRTVGEEYLEDDIPHIGMVRDPKAND